MSPTVGFTTYDLGLRDYEETRQLQLKLVEKRLAGGPDSLILVEHPHVITRGTGFKGRTMGTLGDANSSIPIYDVERGGDITYHGPGQLVGYPILHLNEQDLCLSEYIR
ncbi:MAG: lipoyl(octanoyl) transferase LipB, partial [Elusimicrobia bacterium]|nr:lipoyl(octanoyl) transferase LipB [Elusimicrobiota bacterium]